MTLSNQQVKRIQLLLSLAATFMMHCNSQQLAPQTPATDIPSPIVLHQLDLDAHIQIVSDLHVEFYNAPDQIPLDIIVRRAPILALLGDIGLTFTETLRHFLHQQADRFDHVLFLAGNHEFYNHGSTHTVEEQLVWMKQVCAEKPNLHFMEKQVVEIGGVTILGTTLWSHVPQRLAVTVGRSLNDYHLSFVNKGKGHHTKMTPDCTNQWHREDVAWLEKEIEKSAGADQPIVVLTHHTPSLQGTSDPKYDGSDMSYGFSSDLRHKDPVKVWACGHTHYNFNLTFSNNQTRLVSNQRGYPGRAKHDYDKEGLVIRISPPTVREEIQN